MRKRILTLGILMVLAIFALVACSTAGQAPSGAEAQAKAQQENIERAFAENPLPKVENHLTRKTVTKWMVSQDRTNVPYYNYIMADNGAIVAYFISESRPVPGCAFLSQPEKIVDRGHSSRSMIAVTAPSFDGVYYSGDCEYMKYFFDAASGALVELYGLNMVSINAPLKIDVPRLEVELVSAETELGTEGSPGG